MYAFLSSLLGYQSLGSLEEYSEHKISLINIFGEADSIIKEFN